MIAIVSHPLLGDYLTRTSRMSGVQILYPLTSKWFSTGSTTWQAIYTYTEIALLATFLIIATVTKDIKTLTRHHPSNLLLLIPISTAFLPVFTQFPIPVPTELIIPHIIVMLLLSLSIIADLRHFLGMCLHP